MTTCTDHYEHHLAPVYLWMAGGAQAALQTGRDEIEALALPLGPGSSVVDLGAGFGMHAIPMAQSGATVVAIDASPLLLRTLEELRGVAPVRGVCDDLLAFPAYLTEPPDAILCMGDTITHLPDAGAVSSLVQSAAAMLDRGGAFVVSLRDYSEPLLGDQRFIPVRSDNTRLLTCFLEYESKSILVHDILHERTADGWAMRVSHYRKLRLAIGELLALMESAGFEVRREAGVRGLVRLVATRR
jgi:2-polyprenyl-3-methyl-5-hydroxy-6-metoxy-1,4-benzoquinol methylase